MAANWQSLPDVARGRKESLSAYRRPQYGTRSAADSGLSREKMNKKKKAAVCEFALMNVLNIIKIRGM